MFYANVAQLHLLLPLPMNKDAYIFKYLKDSVDLSKQQEIFLNKKEVQFMLTL